MSKDMDSVAFGFHGGMDVISSYLRVVGENVSVDVHNSDGQQTIVSVPPRFQNSFETHLKTSGVTYRIDKLRNFLRWEV